MSDTPSPSPAASTRLDPPTVLSALGSDVRWPIMKTLADGRPRNFSDIVSAHGREYAATLRHMKVLCDAGILKACFGEDRRLTVYQIPAAHLRAPGVLDYGFCVVDFNKV